MKKLKTIAVGQTNRGWNTMLISGNLIRPYKIRRLINKNFKTRKKAVIYARKLYRKYRAPIQFS